MTRTPARPLPSFTVRSRSFIAVAVVLAVLLVGGAAAYAFDQSRKDTIADGISVAGIDVGGMTRAEARLAVRREYASRFDRPVVVMHDGKRFALAPRQARIRVDVDATVDEAIARTREGNLFTRIWREATGGKVDAVLRPDISYSGRAVRRFVRNVGRSVGRAPQDASINFATESLSPVPGRTGITVHERRLREAVTAAIVRQGAAKLTVPVGTVQPKVTTEQLAQRYPTVVTISRGGFTLRLWKGLKLQKSYPIAVGQAGLETPAGLYNIQDKQVNPSWHVPNSAWAGSLAGQVIPPGPADPIKARWMGIAGGAGIHGTDNVGSLGSAASHGCIRMAIPDVEDLFNRVSVGTPVYIA